MNSGLALVNGRLFLDTFDGRVICIEAVSGKQLWAQHFDNVLMSTPVISGDIVIVGTGKNGMLGAPRDSKVYALRPSAPENQVWGRLEGDHIIALDVNSGKMLWKYRTAGEDMPSGSIYRGLVIVANGDQHVYGLRLKDGTPTWRVTTNGIATMASVNEEDGIAVASVCNFASGQVKTIAMSAYTGRVLWAASAGSCDAAPTIARGIVFLSGSREGTLAGLPGGSADVAAVDIHTGRLKWSYVSDQIGPYSRVGSNERAITGAYQRGLYVQPVPTNNEVVAFSAASGKVVWTFKTIAPVKMSPVIVDSRMYFGDVAGIFYEVGLLYGKLIKLKSYEDAFSTTPPVIIGRLAYIIHGSTLEAVSI